MRLYGLKEALAKYIDIESAVILASAGITQPARQITNVFSLTSLAFGELLDWVRSNDLVDNNTSCPAIRVSSLSNRGGVNLPRGLNPYFQDEDSLVITGQGDHLEIMGEKSWQKGREEILAEMPSLDDLPDCIRMLHF